MSKNFICYKKSKSNIFFSPEIPKALLHWHKAPPTLQLFINKNVNILLTLSSLDHFHLNNVIVAAAVLA